MITKTFVVTALLFLVLLLAVGVFIAEHNNGLETLSSFAVIERFNGRRRRRRRRRPRRRNQQQQQEIERNRRVWRRGS